MKAFTLFVLFSAVIMINCAIPTGKYRIRSEKYDTYWDLCGSNTECPDPVNIFAHHFLGDIFQTFTVTALPNGFYSITALFNGRGVAATEAANPSDTIFLTAANSDNYNQQFVFVKRGDNTYIIKPRSLLSEAIQPPAVEDGEIFLTDKNCGSKVQHFVLEPLPEFLNFDLDGSQPQNRL